MSALSAFRRVIRQKAKISLTISCRTLCSRPVATSRQPVVICRATNVIRRSLSVDVKSRGSYQSQVPLLVFANEADRQRPTKPRRPNGAIADIADRTANIADNDVTNLNGTLRSSRSPTPLPQLQGQGQAELLLQHRELLSPVGPTAIARPRSRWTAVRTSPYGKLFKVELSALAAFSSAFGYYLAGGSLIALMGPGTGGLVIGGAVLNAFAAAVANQMMEIPYDAMMERTRTRPLVTGQITKQWAAVLGIGSSVVGCGMLYFACGSLTAPLLALATIGSYTLIYTPLKRRTIYNTEIGALVGAMPVLIGAAAFNPALFAHPNSIAFMSVLFGYAFMTVWQMPHFMMIASQFERQYYKAGYMMRGLLYGNIKPPMYGFLWAITLLALPVIGCHLDLTTPAFLITGTAATSWFLSSYWSFVVNPVSNRKRGHVYIYFCILFALICCHNTIHHGEIITFLSSLNWPIADAVAEGIRSLQTLFPEELQSNNALKKVMPGWVAQTCPKLQHDHLIATKAISNLCPVIQVENVKEKVHHAVNTDDKSSQIESPS